MTPAELEVELAALRRDLAAARGLAEAAMSAAAAARGELEALRAAVRGSSHLSPGPAPAPALAPRTSSLASAVSGEIGSSGPAGPPPLSMSALAEPTAASVAAEPTSRAEPTAARVDAEPAIGAEPALASSGAEPTNRSEPAPASVSVEPAAASVVGDDPSPNLALAEPASSAASAEPTAPAKKVPSSLAALSELVSDEGSPAPQLADLPLQPAGLLAVAASGVRTAPIDLDRIDGVANDEEERRRARLAALEARLTRTDFDAGRRGRLLELAAARQVPDPAGPGLGSFVVTLLLVGLCIYFDVWPLATLPPIALLCVHLWRREQNERLARLARGFAVPLHGRVLRDADEVLAWLNAFWPGNLRPEDIWTSHRHIAVASDPDGFPVLLDVQLERTSAGSVDYRPRVDFYVATHWPARLPLLRPGSSEMSPAIAELYARLRRAGFTIRVESEAGLLLHGSESVVERVHRDPEQLGGLHGIVRDAVTLARQLGATPAAAPTASPPRTGV
ncbi:MAG: hypothetical protein JNL82_18265 [Myxococcales bacterium]|nr:hypothetical protein [Myxococcales bacterium]